MFINLILIQSIPHLIIIITVFKCLVCVEHYVKPFAYMISFDPYDMPPTQVGQGPLLFTSIAKRTEAEED